MSAETVTRPRPMSHGEQLSFAADNYQRQVNELQTLAEKRFWTLYYDEQLHWYGVKDALGRIIQSPTILPTLRGFFASQPSQA